MTRPLVVLPIAILTLLLASESRATVFQIPGAGDNVQQIVNQASDGDEIVFTAVRQGANPNYLPFLVNRAISVSKSSTAEIVVEATGSQDYAVAMSSAGASISGLTLRGGDVCICDVWAGTVTDCIIEDNGNPFTSAGALVATGGLVERCTFELTSPGATAIKINSGSVSDAPMAIDNTINIDVSSGVQAEGILVQGTGSELRRNRITFTGDYNNYGVGICIPDSSGQKSKVFSNVISSAYSGIYVDMGNTSIGEIQISGNIVEDCNQCIVAVYGKNYTIADNTIVGLGGYPYPIGLLFYSVNTNVWTDVRQNLLVNIHTGLIFQTNTDQTAWTIAHNGYYNSGEDFYVSDDTLGTAELRTDLVPRFCEGRDGTQPYSHRVDSDYNPANTTAFDGEVVGAYGLECAFGNLLRSSMVPEDSTLKIIEDVRIPSGTTLTVEEGATLAVDNDDDSGGGVDASRNELIVDGTLTVSGTSSKSVTITSSQSSPAAGDWNGIMVNHDATLNLAYTTVRYANCAIQDSVDGPATSIDLDHVTLEDFQTAGLYCYPASQPSDESGVVDIDHLTVGMQGAPYGLYFQCPPAGRKAYTISIDDAQVTGNYAGTYGLYLNMQGVAGVGVEPVITNFSATGLSNGTGAYIKNYSPLLRNVDVSYCQWGVQLIGSNAPSISSYDSNASTLTECTTGLYVKDCGPTVSDPVITNCQTGLHTDTGASGTYSEVSIAGGQTGFRAKSSSSHTFQGGSITEFSLYGVLTNSGCGVNITGNNIYSSVQGVSKYVRVNPYLSELGDVMAENNWWGADPPPSSKFTTGVDYSPWSTASNIDLQLQPMTAAEPLADGFEATPNPFRTEVVFRIDTGAPENGSTLEVFDIQGRLLRRIETGPLSEGSHEIRWDGRDEVGRQVATGIYFARRIGKGTHFLRLARLAR